MAKSKDDLIKKIHICIVVTMFICLIVQIIALRLNVEYIFYIFEYLFGFFFGISLGFGIGARILL